MQNNRQHQKSQLLLLGIAVTVLSVASGCATKAPPTAALATAQEQITAAEEAGLSEQAPLELRFANERLAGARFAIEDRDYQRAEHLIAEAMVNIELARVRADATAAREQVTALKQRNQRLRDDLGLVE